MTSPEFQNSTRLGITCLKHLVLSYLMHLFFGEVKAQNTEVVSWNFDTSTTFADASQINPAITSLPLRWTASNQMSMGRVNVSPYYLNTGQLWLGAEDPVFVDQRTSLTPRSAKSLSTTFTLGPQASGSWSSLGLSMRYQRPTTAPTKARAVLTWQQDGVYKRTYTPAMSLSGSSWTTISAAFSSGDTKPTTLAGLPCLLEIYFWGTSTTPNSINVDDVKLLCDSLSNVWTMTPSSLTAWPQSKAYWAQFGVQGYASAITWSSGGTLPPGLVFDTVNGRLTGTPTTQGIYNFSVTATGTGLSQTTSYSLTINAPPTGPPALPILAKWTWDNDSSATTFTTLPAGDVSAAIAEATHGYMGGATLTGGLYAGGSSSTSSYPMNSAGGGQMRSFSGWETAANYSTARSDLRHLNTGNSPRFGVYPAANTSSIPKASQTGAGESGALQTRLAFDVNSIGDVKAFYFDALRWQAGRMDISGSNGPRWAELHAYWLNDSGVIQRWDSAALDITAVYRPEHRGTNQFGRFWFDLDNGSTGLNHRIKATAQRYRAGRQVFFDLYVYHDTGADVSGIGASNPPSLLIDEIAVLGSMTAAAPLVSVGNAVFNDTNYNGRYDVGEGVPGVSVQLLDMGGTVLQSMTTSTGGSYLFSGLSEGDYLVKIPATEFVVGRPLHGLVSITGNGTDNGVDDGGDENGIDNAAPETQGIVSSAINLYASSEPTSAETGFNGDSDDAGDDASDLTVDFGFQNKPAFSIGDRVFMDSNSNNLYDPGEGVDGVSVELLNSSQVVLATQTTSSEGRYLFSGLSNTGTYYVRIASRNFSGGSILNGWISVAGNGPDNSTDHDDNGVDDAATTTNGIKSILITPGSNQGGVFSHTWPASASATVNHAGGTWEQVFLRHDYNAKTMDVSVTLDTATQNTQALWMVISNGTSTAGPSSNLAAIYVANGQVKVTPYTSSGTSTHTLGTVIYSTTYTTTNLGTKRTLRFTLDTHAINRWAAQPATWQGTGFPYDAQGAQPDHSAKQISLRLRSFADGAATLSGSTWSVAYGVAPDPNIGSFDDVSAISHIGANVAVEFGFRPDSADFGDYDKFGLASSGASAQLRIGALIDGENSPSANAAASGDDTQGSDDEDGVILPATLSPGASASLVANVTNLSGLPGYLNAWIDFDGDGLLTGAGEQIASDIVIAPGASASNQALSFTVPRIAALQTVGVRVRLSSQINPGPLGLAGVGEVEDYTVLIACPTITMTPSSLSAAIGGQAYEQLITGSGGGAAYRWTVASGSLPPGLTLQQGPTYWTGSSTSYPNVFAPAGHATVNPPNGSLFSIVLGGSAGPVQSGIWSMRATGGAGVSLLFLGLLETGARTEIDGSALKFKVSNNSSTLLGALGVGTAITTSWEATASLNQPRAVKALQPNSQYKVTFHVDGSNGLLESGLGIVPTFTAELLDGSGAQVASESSGTLINLLGLLGTGVTSGTVTLTFNTGAVVPAGPPSLRFRGSSVLNTTVLGLGTTFATIDQLTISQVAPDYSMSGRISGTPVCTPGTYSFTLQAQDQNSCVGTRAYTLTVNVPTITLSPSSLPNATAGVAYHQTIPFSASGGTAPYTYLVSGLPAGMSFDGNTNRITGTATQTGAYTVTVESKDAPCCGGTQSLVMNVVSANNLGIGNLIWEDANNNGFKEASEIGLAGAIVRLYHPGADNAIGGSSANADVQVGATQTTSGSGQYLFQNLAAGRYYVRVTPPASYYKTGGVPVAADNQTDHDNNGSQPGGVGSAVYSPVIALIQGGETIAEDGDANTDLTVDIGLWPGFTVGSHVFEDVNNNGLMDGSETGVPGVVAQLISTGADQTMLTGDDVVLAITSTTATGAYSFAVPQTGKFFVRMQPPSHLPMSSTVAFGDNGVDGDNNGTQLGGALGPVSSMAFTLQPKSEPSLSGSTNTENTIDFGLWTGLSLGGYVWNDANYNGVTDPAGGGFTSPETGIAGVALQLYSTGADGVMGGVNADVLVAATTTAADGSYRFRNLTRGRYYVRTTPPSTHRQASLAVDAVDNGETHDNNGVQPGGLGTVVISPVIQLTEVMEPGNAGSTNHDGTLWFGLFQPPTIEVLPLTLPGGFTDNPYVQSVTASGGTGPYNFGLPSGELPPGLSLHPVTGAITGEPISTGTFVFTIRAIDRDGFIGTRDYSVLIKRITISPPVLRPAYEAYYYSQLLTASEGTEPYTWSLISGSLPPGISLSLASGQLAGTPTTVGSYPFTVQALDTNGIRGVKSYTLQVLTTVSIGNLVFEDYDDNGRHDPGEGMDGVTVELYYADQVPGTDTPVASTLTANGGRYLFMDVEPREYIVHVPASQFGMSGLLRGLASLPGVQAGDDDWGEDGLDSAHPESTGISTQALLLASDGAPTDASNETGFDHTADNLLPKGDDSTDLTIDFGFYRRVSVGNLVFYDDNGNGHADSGEGIAGVIVQLYRADQVPEVDMPLAMTMTELDGRYLFDDLRAGLYRVHVPATMFQSGAPLHGMLSIAQGMFGDDDVGEDGLNATYPPEQGVSANEVVLMAALAPTLENGETGYDSSSDDAVDAAKDLTVDFGFQRPVSVGNLVFVDQNANGRYDAGEGVDGVWVELYEGGAVPGSSSPVASMITQHGGHYVFTGLPGGTYVLHLPAQNFLPEAPLHGMLSTAGTGLAGSDDSRGEDGLDVPQPELFGISTAEVVLVPGTLPVDSSSSSESGENGFLAAEDNGNSQDANGDMTIDFGLVPLDPNKVGVGNAVFSDQNGNRRMDEGEGVNGVLVHLHGSAHGLALASATTSGDGHYYFGNLAPGSYFVVVDASNFSPSGPLARLVPMSGQGADNGLDDDTDENGDDPADLVLSGVRSTEFVLQPGSEPTDAGTELGSNSYIDSAADGNNDLTIDFGFYPLGGLGNLVFLDANRNGHADPGEGVGGVTVNLFHANDDPLFAQPRASVVTSSAPGLQGFYWFQNLPPGGYVVHVPASMFAEGAPLRDKLSLVSSADPRSDDDQGEDGLETLSPAEQGVTTSVILLHPGQEPAGLGEESGFLSGMDDSVGDADHNLTVDLGFATGICVGNLVFLDHDEDGKYTSGTDEGAGAVMVELVQHLEDGNTALVRTTFTSSIGEYGFCVPPGSYSLRIPALMFEEGHPLFNRRATSAGAQAGDDDSGQDAVDGGIPIETGADTAVFTLAEGTQPTASSGETGFQAVTDDARDANTNLMIDLGFGYGVGFPLAGRVRRDLDLNGKAGAQDAPLANVEVAVYPDANGSGTLDRGEMNAVDVRMTNAKGEYAFDGLASGTYIVTAAALPGSVASADTDGGAPDQTVIVIAEAPVEDVDFLQVLAPSSYTEWQLKHGAGGPDENDDVDSFDNLMEYALGLDPTSGVLAKTPFEVVAAPGGDALLKRPAHARSDVRFILDGCVEGGNWQRLARVPRSLMSGGEEILYWSELASDPLFQGQAFGLVRLRVILDSNLDGWAEHTSTSPTFAFLNRHFQASQATLSMPLVLPEVYAGEVSVLNARRLAPAHAAGWKAALPPGTPAYAEIMEGPHAGHCLDLLLKDCSDTVLALAVDLPKGYAGSRLVVRPHRTLATLLPPGRFQSAGSAAEADRVLFFDQGVYRVHWLASIAKGSPHWVSDATLQDSGAIPVRRDDGVFIHPRRSGVDLWFAGQLPVPRNPTAPERGKRLVAVDAIPGTPLGVQEGDKLCIWRGDLSPGETGFVVHSFTGGVWRRESDGALVGAETWKMAYRAVVQVAP